jgi:hypothetical protein
MKVGQVYDEPSRPARPVDYHDLSSLTEQLIAASDELSRLSQEVAKAKTIREYNSDQRKRALALATREFLDTDSAAAAEVKGRASLRYGDDLKQLQNDLYEAEQCLSKHEAARIRWETIRSALSSWKSISGNI